MKLRTAVLGGVAVGVVGFAIWLLRAPADAPTAAASRPSRATTRSTQPTLEASAAPAARPKMVLTPGGWRPQTTHDKPREWVDPASGAINRELLDAVPDPEGEAREELKYRKGRLKFLLADAAAPCWTGADSKQEIEFEYSLIVEHEQIRTDNVRIKSSNVSDPTVERCIVDAVRGLQSPAYKIPDMRQDEGMFMSLHDLYDRNERNIRDPAAQTDR
jgi:hypothetical protein